ncbi:hypothetical protein ACS0TY_009715 [Phlomoides rotata]
MVRPMPIVHVRESFSPVLLALGLFVSVTLLVSLCAKHAKKYTSKTGDPNTAKAPLKQMVAAISHKGMTVNGKKSSSDGGRNNKEDEDSGVWQKAILMGEKCQPPEFSGVIYYDYSGNRVPEMPKSPRNTPMSHLRSLNLPRNENSMY